MNTKKQQWIFYLIAATIIATIAVQFYWNYKNYEENKQRVTNEIQLSLDNAVEEYYSSLAKSNFITILNSNTETNQATNPEKSSWLSVLKKIKNKPVAGEKPRVTINNIKITSDENLPQEKIDSMMNSAKKFATEFNLEKDSTIQLIKNNSSTTPIITHFTDDKNGFNIDKNGKKTTIKYFNGKKAADSLKLITHLKPIFISFLDDSIDYKKIDSLLENQLEQKGINIKTSFHHVKNDTLFHQTKDTVLDAKTFVVHSKSTYLKDDEGFELAYNNPNFEALQRSFGGIFLSFLLSLLIISSLFYLLNVINQQKELATIKNDLISNITHEFKTPIATVSTAIEAIENFNVLDDKEKTKKYLAMSAVQLKKLHQMVEKLLETATLDSESLLLKKEETDLVFLVDKLTARHQLLAPTKSVKFSSNIKYLPIDIDVFHFENAVSNLIDNAVKYGGNLVEVAINSVLNFIEISVVDNGNGIDKNQHEKIFDKFYRVPKGNTHNIKGFGIGLYYTKKIIEKHNGTIEVFVNAQNTIFKITLPNEKN